MQKTLVSTLAVAALSLSTSVALAGPTIDQVKKRGNLVGGANPGIAGFGLPDDKGAWTGFDVDFCRAIAAAIFNTGAMLIIQAAGDPTSAMAATAVVVAPVVEESLKGLLVLLIWRLRRQSFSFNLQPLPQSVGHHFSLTLQPTTYSLPCC